MFYLNQRYAPVKALCTTEVDKIIKRITTIKGGYTFWMSLKEQGKLGRVNLRKRWSEQILTALFPQVLCRAMVRASVNADGIPTPQSNELYTWVLHHIYNGHTDAFYHDWLVLK